MLKSKQVAEYLLTKDNIEIGDLTSNLKLQKLVYYAQGFYLALNDEPLFLEIIEAWSHGPVIPELYYEYKKYDSGAIPQPEKTNFDNIDNETKEFLDEIYDSFAQFSAWKLRNMTHEEIPYQKAKNRNQNNQINHDDMKKYFKTLCV